MFISQSLFNLGVQIKIYTIEKRMKKTNKFLIFYLIVEF